MQTITNCKKCGKLFVPMGKRDICNACFQEQTQIIDAMNLYVVRYPEEKIAVEELLEKFDMPLKEFEVLFANGRFTKCSKKLTIKCIRCGKEVSIERKTRFLCNECISKLQNEL